MTQNKHNIWVVIPTYNEEQVIGSVLDELLKVGYDVVVVDDGSTDETYEVAKSRQIHLLRHILNFGQGAALETGKEYALSCGADMICTFDSDGQHRVEDVQVLYSVLRGEDVDVVIGSRFLGEATGMPKSRLIFLKLGVLFHRLFYGLDLTDTHNGLRMMTRFAAQKLIISSPGMAHATEILASIHEHQLKIKEAPVSIRYTEYSLNKGQNIFSFINTLKELFIGGLYK